MGWWLRGRGYGVEVFRVKDGDVLGGRGEGSVGRG